MDLVPKGRSSNGHSSPGSTLYKSPQAPKPLTLRAYAVLVRCRPRIPVTVDVFGLGLVMESIRETSGWRASRKLSAHPLEFLGNLLVLTEFGNFKSGYVKGTIRSDERLLVVSNEVRRHRLISISYISLLPCHRLPDQNQSGVRRFRA